jgi:GNAT superfamily N-acetyltransferase
VVGGERRGSRHRRGIRGHLREPDPVARTLRSMWVEPAHRGQGLADGLVMAVAAWARSEGARVLTLWVLDGNARALAC